MGSVIPNIQEFTVTVDPRPPVPEIDLVTAPPRHDDVRRNGLRLRCQPHPAERECWRGVESRWSNRPRRPRHHHRARHWQSELHRFSTEWGDCSTATLSGQKTSSGRATRRRSPSMRSTRRRHRFSPSRRILMFTLEVGEPFPGASATATGQPTPELTIVGTLPDFLDFDPLTGLLSAAATQPAPVGSGHRRALVQYRGHQYRRNGQRDDRHHGHRRAAQRRLDHAGCGAPSVRRARSSFAAGGFVSAATLR